jgi:ubiquinone/menaquinone biosynthesis C-methylase UbiE
MAEDTQRFSDGTAYEQFMGRWTRAVGTIFLQWLAPPTDARWLDIGCGTGVFTDLIVSTCSPATVVAIDPSEPQIEIARKKTIAQRADFRVADAQELPFSDKAFDVVVSALVINFISDRPHALAEMCRVCRPHGVIAGYVWDFPAQRGPASLIRDGLQQVGAKPPPVPGTEHSRLDALTSLFARAKLSEIGSRTIDVMMSFADFNEFWVSQTPGYTPMGQMIAALSETDRQKVIDWVRARLPAGPDGRITYSARANAIKARPPV